MPTVEPHSTVPLLPAKVVLARAGAAPLMALIRIRMGFPAETFARAVQPLIDAVALWWQLSPVPGSGRHGVPGGRVLRALELGLRALDVRRERILPPGAPPEVLGDLAHRWTYAVLTVALLRDVVAQGPELAQRLLQDGLPERVSQWLADDEAVVQALREALSGRAGDSQPIVQIVECAVGGGVGRRPATTPAVVAAVATEQPGQGASTASAGAGTGSDPGTGRVDERNEVEPVEPSSWGDASGTERTDAGSASTPEPDTLPPVDVHASGRPGAFLGWLRRAMADGSLEVNTRSALLHRVPEGLLLVSPGIFRAFLDASGDADTGVAEGWRRLQREVLKADWHLRGEGGVTLHGYAWVKAGKPGARVHGLVIPWPGRRLFDALPPLNERLVRQDTVVVPAPAP